MDKDTRNAIERATQRSRKLLEEDFAAQLEGNFDIHRDGAVAAKPGPHLTPRQAFQRERVVAAIEHKRAAGMSASDAARDYLRDAAFTTLNRFVALKILEARDLVQECITKGDQSAGYREFCGMAPGLALLPDSAGYRLYIESLFDELSTEVKVLFDRRDPSSVLWPKRATFEQLFEILNQGELASVWAEDETIGWVYQSFNDQDERRRMREESQAPRNSRELAVRNQFFTPRYVVQFLTDNTLGRIWYEMRSGNTRLAEREYMVQKADEDVVHRAKKDPRDLRVLDPACGSGHFLLYSFDLLLTIYEEAYGDPESPKSEATGTALAEDYPSLDALRNAVPGLILAYNLLGVDIDFRCAQIAQLALWMRAQRAYRTFGIGRAERPRIRRTNIVVAEPLVADSALEADFVARLEDAELTHLFKGLLNVLKLAGDLGLLLHIEDLVQGQLGQDRITDLFTLPVDRIRAALQHFIAEKDGRASTQRRLFAEDATQGAGLLSIAEQRYDVVLMNPPFGDPTPAGKPLLFETYGRERIDLGGCFISRFLGRLLRGGRLGVIANRTLLFAATLGDWRKERLLGAIAVVDLGHGVLDALVETAALVIGNEAMDSTLFVGAIDSIAKDERMRAAIRAVSNGDRACLRSVSEFQALFGAPFAYWAPTPVIAKVAQLRPAEAVGAIARQGLATCDNFRFLRLSQEVGDDGKNWVPLTKGGEYQPFWAEVPLRVRWTDNGREIKAYIDALHGQWSRVVQSTDLYRIPGATYSGRTASSLSLRILPRESIFDKKGPFVGAPIEGESERIAVSLIGLSYSTPYRFLIETAVGLRDSTTSGSAARDYLPSMVQRLPWPDFSSEQMEALNTESRTAITATRRLSATMEETSQFWHEADDWKDFPSIEALAAARWSRWCDEQSQIYGAAEKLEQLGILAAGVSHRDDYAALEEVAGRCVFAYDRLTLTDVDELRKLMEMPAEKLINLVRGSGYTHSTIFKKGFWGDRSVELIAHLLRRHPLSVLDALKRAGPGRAWIQRTGWRILSAAIAIVFGRVRPEGLFIRTELAVPDDIFAAPKVPIRIRLGLARAILVDDAGHEDDLVRLVEEVISARCGERAVDELLFVLGGESDKTSLRELVSRAFFAQHLSAYSDYRRQAPIYWQLTVPSARYSVWLYLHAQGSDTLYKVQHEYVAPKLEHEERRLETLRHEIGNSAKSGDRRALAAQEAYVDELRTFGDELRRIAPLWDPKLDDGVIINFSLLWRLVPQNKVWQKELKATWESLCMGEYDWAHLAMHLWPERVVPKCVTDRSFAIAHALEEVFWIEGTDGKWTARKTPTRTVEALVLERASQAVKSALESLLEASATSDNRGRGLGRRQSLAAALGGES
jgi:Eco57I restriction-modification methylase